MTSYVHRWERPSAAWRTTVGEIAKKGFLRKGDVSESFAKRLTDPLFLDPPARLFSLSGVGNGGANRFSSVDFFGEQLNRTNYIVVNDEKFRKWVSALLESKFRTQNPNPGRSLVAAFTYYMHDSNLHWSGCVEGKRGAVQ